jgi:hypothetical protein
LSARNQNCNFGILCIRAQLDLNRKISVGGKLMSGSTISTYVTHAVTISPEGYLSPLLITKTGTINLGSGSESSALKIDDSPVIATITNDGLIQGNSGINAGFGISVYSRAKITNHGVIRGGAGYPHVYSYDGMQNYDVGLGADGIFVGLAGAHSTILDSGKIYGGSGHLFDGQTGYSGAGVDLFLTKDVKLDVSRSGTIAGGYGGSAYGNSFTGDGVILGVDTLDNSGLIIGGQGGALPAHIYNTYRSDPHAGLAGGIGVLAEGGQVANVGTIAGGAGGSHGERYGGKGGAGLVGIGAHNGPDARIVNFGTIEGGAGGNGGRFGADGGVGVELEKNSDLRNFGHIVGGNGGYGDRFKQNQASGAGVLMYSGATLQNFGEISPGGGMGPSDGTGVLARGGSIMNAGAIQVSGPGYGVDLERADLTNTGQITAGGVSGVGVLLYGSNTLINSGTISGGDAAVILTSRYTHDVGTLIVENGAVFNGGVTALGHDILEFSGTSKTVETGIGTQFIDFGKIEFAKGAQWTISGDTAGLASGQAITGFGPADAITLTDAGASSGVVSVAKAGVVSIDAGGVISKLDIAGATVGETNFKFSNFTLTESAPAMAFLFPSAAPREAHPLANLDVLQHFAQPPAPASLSHPASAETPVFGAIMGPLFAPHIDAVPIVTLHA